MISVKTKFEAKYHEDQQKHTISITNLVSVTEASCDDKAESHKGPINFRNINLALELVIGMYNLTCGKQPRAADCLTIENVADMMARNNDRYCC
jgi:hypothetical protein